MIVLILFGIAVFVIVSSLLWYPYYKWRDGDIKSIKGPFMYPFVGIIYEFKDSKQIFTKMKHLHDTFGETFRGYFLNEQNLMTIDEDFIEFAMTNNKAINKGSVYDFFHKWLGTGLLTSGGNKWHKRRKMITPAYHFTVLDQFIEIFDRNGNIMVKKLQSELNKEQTDIYPYVNLCALDTICETAMGTRVNAQESSDSEFVFATKEMSRIVMARGFEAMKAFDATFFFTEDYWKQKKALSVLHGYTMGLIKSRRSELIKKQQNNTTKKEPNEFETKRKDNFLDLLLKSTIDGQPLSDEDIREEVDTFTFEGHDTVSSGISFAFYFISNHPEVQEKLLEEQKHIYHDEPHRSTTLADLKEMKYLEMVIKETLRLCPPVPMMSREISENVQYKDMLLRKRTQIVVFTYELHRNPKVFPEPEKFIPERFSPEKQAGRHPYSYIPFSAGHRNCIGQKFAMLEMKSAISKMIRNYELLPLVPKHKPLILPEIILRAENGVLLKLGKRNW